MGNEGKGNLTNLYKTIFENISDAVFLVTVENNETFSYESANPFMLSILGYTEGKIVGKTPVDVFGKKTGFKMINKFRKCVKYGNKMEYEETLNFPAGEKTWLTKLSPIKMDDKVEKIVVLSTEYKQSEELKQQKFELRERNKELTCLFNISETVQRSEEPLEQMLQAFVKLIPPAFQYPEHTCARIVFEGKSYQTENFKTTTSILKSDIYLHKEKTGYLEVFLMNEPVEKKTVSFLENERKLINTITERIGRTAEHKQSEEQIYINESKYRFLFESMAQGVVYQDKHGKITSANSAAVKMLGISLAQLQGKESPNSIWKPIHKDGTAFSSIEHPTVVALRTGKSIYGEVMGIYNPQEKSYRWIVVNAIPQFREGQDEPYQVYASFEDITNLIETQKALEKSERQNYLLVSKMEQGLAVHEIILDQDDKPCDYRFLYVNKSFEKLMGLKKEQIIGKSVLEVLPNTESYWIEKYGEVAITGESIKYENYSKELGRYFSVVAYSPQPKQFAVIISDITEEKKKQLLLIKQKKELKNANDEMKTINETLKATNEEMEAMNEELTEREEEAVRANNVKSEFLATMSHELRTPLNGVIGFSDILKTTNLDETQGEYLDIILHSAHNLLDIISDILDMTKLEADMTKIIPEMANLREVVMKSLDIVDYRSKEKGLKLNMNISYDCPEYVYCDSARLKQILLNLLSNSVKFTDVGEVTLLLQVKHIEKERKQVTCHFCIKDTGIGIKEKDLKTLFEPFTQVDMSNTRKYEGTGLGLSITQRLLEKMGSTLHVKSEYGKGSEFYFELTMPYEIEEKNKPETKLTEENEVSSKYVNTKILLAEDNTINRALIRAAISMFSKDIQIIEAENGKVAYEMYLKHKPNLIFMDIVMPEVDGYRACAMIRQKDKKIPIIAMTAKALKGDREECLKAGMDDYLSKPISLPELRSTLEKYL
jgi:PAS domain S-box-containing protein